MKRILLITCCTLSLSGGAAVKIASESSGGGLKIEPELDVLLVDLC